MRGYGYCPANFAGLSRGCRRKYMQGGPCTVWAMYSMTVELEPKRGYYSEAAPSGDGRTFSSLPLQEACE